MQRNAALQKFPNLSDFARRLLAERKRLDLKLDDANKRIVVGVSGGADSLALLLALDELRKARRLQSSIVVAHLNHSLRDAESDVDAEAVREVATTLNCETAIETIDVAAHAAKTGDNLEQAARRARHDFLQRVAIKREAECVLLAHTMDDQAETVLLRLMRGSGANGLSAMRVARRLSDESEILLVRPLLRWARRAETEKYCAMRGFEFRIDEMNDDENFARVRVRKQLLPLMRELNPRIVETLVRTADVLREDADALDESARELLANAHIETENERASLSVKTLYAANVALRRRALRLWLAENQGHLRRIEALHIRSIETLLEGERGNRIIEIPSGHRIVRRKNRIYFQASKSHSTPKSQS